MAKRTHEQLLAEVAAATAVGNTESDTLAPLVVEPAAPIQVIRHRGAWHLLVVATMRTGCCDQPVGEIREVASEMPADGKRCSKLVIA